MRAKFIEKQAYVFDWDDTLVKTDAKIYIYKNKRQIKVLTPYEFNSYEAKPDEDLDLSDFKDPRLIQNARKYKMWPALKKVDMDKKQGISDIDIFILTARNPICAGPIHNYLIKNGINIPEENVLTIGGEQSGINVALEKKIILEKLKKLYSNIVFFDDNPMNIRLASEIGEIQTCLVD